MTKTSLEAFEKGRAASNAHGIDAFAELPADDVVFTAQTGCTVIERRPAPRSSAAGSLP